MKKDEDTYFAKGGEIDNIISRSMKEYGLTEEDIAEAKKELLKKVAGIRQKMEKGGSSLFDYLLTFRPVENKYNNKDNTFGYQRQGQDGSYGGINTDERLNYYKTFNPVAYDAYMRASEGTRARALQDVIYGQNKDGWAWPRRRTRLSPTPRRFGITRRSFPLAVRIVKAITRKIRKPHIMIG